MLTLTSTPTPAPVNSDTIAHEMKPIEENNVLGEIEEAMDIDSGHIDESIGLDDAPSIMDNKSTRL